MSVSLIFCKQHRQVYRWHSELPASESEKARYRRVLPAALKRYMRWRQCVEAQQLLTGSGLVSMRNSSSVIATILLAAHRRGDGSHALLPIATLHAVLDMLCLRNDSFVTNDLWHCSPPLEIRKLLFFVRCSHPSSPQRTISLWLPKELDDFEYVGWQDRIKWQGHSFSVCADPLRSLADSIIDIVGLAVPFLRVLVVGSENDDKVSPVITDGTSV